MTSLFKRIGKGKDFGMGKKTFFPQFLTASPDLVLQAVRNYFKIGGNQRAASFAYYAFFSLFPLAILTVSIASFFVDRERAVREVVGYFKHYAPLNAEGNQGVFDVIQDLVRARGL